MHRRQEMRREKEKAQHRGTAPNHTHHDINRVEKICLIFFAIFVVLYIGGYYLHNDPMTFLGLGIGVAGFVIQTDINLSEE